MGPEHHTTAVCDPLSGRTFRTLLSHVCLVRLVTVYIEHPNYNDTKSIVNCLPLETTC